MSGKMQEMWISEYVFVLLILLYYTCILIVIIYKLCKNWKNNNNMFVNVSPPSYDTVIYLDEMSCPLYNEINV